MRSSPLADRDLWQADILRYRPDDGQTTGFGRKSVNLIGALPHIAKQAFNGIGAPNVAMHDWWKGIKRQEMLFIFGQAADGFGIALLVFGFEGRQIEQRILFLLLLPNPRQLGSNLLPFTMRNGIHHITLLVDQTALAQGRWKQRGDGCQKPIMPIGDDQINLAHPTIAQILYETTPAIFVFLCTGTEGQHFSAALHLLLGQRAVETTDGAGTGGDSRERLSHLSHLMRAHAAHKHLGQGFGHLGFIAAVALEDLAMKLPFPVAFRL